MTAKDCDRNCTAKADACKAVLIAESRDWKINVILGGVGATFLAVAALVSWTVLRMDRLETTIRSASTEDARSAARVVGDETVSRVRSLLERSEDPRLGALR